MTKSDASKDNDRILIVKTAFLRSSVIYIEKFIVLKLPK